MNIVMGSISKWSSKWRLVINSDPGKTEIICFYSSTPEDVPSSFTIGGDSIYVVNSSKVLGVVIDRKLNFIEHADMVYKRLVFRWITLCRYSNRNWGLHHSVIVFIIKAIIFSSLFYASIVWMSNSNMVKLNSLWYKIAKTAVGPIFNVSADNLEVILGIPPLHIQNQIYRIKHYLKCFNREPTGHDIHMEFLTGQLRKDNVQVTMNFKDVYKFLKWKHGEYPAMFSNRDICIIDEGLYIEFSTLSSGASFYSKSMIKRYCEYIWQHSLSNQAHLQGMSRVPIVSCTTIPLPKIISRQHEVLLLSMFYKNNLLNAFLYLVEV